MSNKTQRISHLLKVASEGNYLLNTTHSGLVHLHRTKGQEWGYIYINKELFTQRRQDLLRDSINNWKIPDILPHISIFTKEEIKLIPADFKMPTRLDFTLTSEVKNIKPSDWKGVSECIFEVVSCPEILKIRKKLGLSEFMFKTHEFHITLGIKKELKKD